MAKLTIKNVSGATIHLENFGHQEVLDNETITLNGSRERLREATQLSTLIDDSDVIVIDSRGDILPPEQGQHLRVGLPDEVIQETGSHRVILYGKAVVDKTLSKGDPVYIGGYNNVTDEFVFDLADSDTITFPAAGIVNTGPITNISGGTIIVTGRIENVDTSQWSTGDNLYVSDSGTLTINRPAGIGNKVQKLAQVLHSDAANGVLLVLGAGRANDLPNLSSGKVWQGDGTGVPKEVDMVSQVTLQNNDSNVINTPHSIINIEGAATIADEGGGKATINITGGGGAGADLAAVQLRRSTGLTDIPLIWTDLSFDTTDVETMDSTIEHDDINTDRVLIKSNGTYRLHYVLTCDDEIQGRIRVNDTTVLPGSTQQSGDPSDTNNVITPNSIVILATLTAGDFVTVQIQAATTSESLKTDALFLVTKLEGAQGDPGPQGPQGVPGSGTTIALQEEGVTLPNTPHSVLNFIGGDLLVSDQGGGIANVAFSAFGGDVATVVARRTTQYITTTGWSDITLDTTDVENDQTIIEHSAGLTDRIVIKQDGIYLITYTVNFVRLTTEENFLAHSRIMNNDSNVVPGSYIYTTNLSDTGSHSLPGEDLTAPLACTTIGSFTNGDWLSLQIMKEELTGTATLYANTDITVSVVRLEATHGHDGIDGTNDINILSEGSNVINTPHGTFDFVGDKLAVSDQGGGIVEINSYHNHDDTYYTETEIDTLTLNGGNF